LKLVIYNVASFLYIKATKRQSILSGCFVFFNEYL
jgi:hypothetical protein